MNTKPSQHLIDAAWGLYCEQTAGSMDVRDFWHELSPKVQLLFLMKVVDSGLSEHSVEYSEPELTTEHARQPKWRAPREETGASDVSTRPSDYAIVQAFRKRPVVIEAAGPITAVNFLAISQWCGGQAKTSLSIIIPTLEGDMRAEAGDWIIKGVKGEFYPCKPDIFAATYEPVEIDAARPEQVQRKFQGVGHLEETGYIPPGSAAERADAELTAEHARVLQDIPKPDDPGERICDACGGAGYIVRPSGSHACWKCGPAERACRDFVEEDGPNGKPTGFLLFGKNAERADDVEAMVAELKEMAVPQPFGTVMYVELDEAILLLRRLAANPAPREDARAAMGALFGESMSAFSQLTTKPQDNQGRIDALRLINQLPDSDELNGQDWSRVSPAVAFHLIDRHAEDWAHAGRLMEAWRISVSERKDAAKPQDDQDRKDAESIGVSPRYGECSLCDGKGYVPTLTGGSRYCEACRATVANSVHSRQEVPGALTDEEKSVIENLLALTYATWNAADNSEDMGDSHNVDHHDYQMICDALDALDGLPDDQPGYTMGPSAKARWALRRHIPIDAAMAQEAGNG